MTAALIGLCALAMMCAGVALLRRRIRAITRAELTRAQMHEALLDAEVARRAADTDPPAPAGEEQPDV